MKRLCLATALVACTIQPAFACAESCSYFVRQEGSERADLESFEHCAFLSGRSYRLFDTHLNALVFDENGLAPIRIGEKHFYVNREGETLPVLTYDNWADSYSEGLTRSYVDGGVAYFDREFTQVIAPKYDWGWPFHDGRALVCKECSLQAPDEHGHRAVDGGLWGYIDRRGNEVVPVTYPRQDLPD